MISKFGTPSGPIPSVVQALEILGADVTFERAHLPLEQRAPDRVILRAVSLPFLIDDALLNGLCSHDGMSGHRCASKRLVRPSREGVRSING